ncbi:uncharacterized protein BDZ99DRAFT_504102 [Mytilinidion resinicola]|uniref:Alcohol dehydrogenase-like N-terminal domain-containing protein n=1 Tax=Mytilinidion resinicola TaxID=574789 RepID=A0A6A6Y099_9PEZI|nr:uncharacterized protein BDZ99DRAFT_504102 [Mytilinidion resinicola]KAF2802079.1 hypothetical protein BDZ99DRAFT_504102 [Mytilinidion resinicola]
MSVLTTTRPWVSDLASGYQGLEFQASAPIPALLSHQVLVRIKKMPLPLVPCSDGAGIIVAVGSDVGPEETSIAVGDEVLCLYNKEHMSGPATAYHMQMGSELPLEGCLTEYKVLPHYSTVKKPVYLS